MKRNMRKLRPSIVCTLAPCMASHRHEYEYNFDCNSPFSDHSESVNFTLYSEHSDVTTRKACTFYVVSFATHVNSTEGYKS